MGKLEFIYKRNEFKFKEQIALSLFKTQGRWVVCFLNYHVVLSSEFLLLTNKRKTLPMARSISNGLFDSHCGLFHYTMSHIFFLCQLQRLKKKKSGGYILHRLQKVNCSSRCLSGSSVPLWSPCHLSPLATRHFPASVPQAQQTQYV